MGRKKRDILKITKKASQAFLKFPKAFVPKISSNILMVSDDGFVDECSYILQDLLSTNNQGVAVTFHLKTRELLEELQERNVDVERELFFVDCISYATGKGAPPVFNCISLNNPDEFENIFYYTIMQLMHIKSNSTFVAVINPSTLLKYADYNELGILFKWYSDGLKRIGVPIIFVCDENADTILTRILSKLARNMRQS